MQIGMIGLGKMGMNMAKRLLQGGHQVVAFARTKSTVNEAVKAGAVGASSVEDLVSKLKAPKAVWLMVPSGKPVDDNLELLRPLLSKNDIVIDGGNSQYTDAERRAGFLKEKGIHMMDVGTSGGIWGMTVGYCLMIGGDQKIFNHLEPVFKTLAPKDGYAYLGAHGAGHFVKMVHNGIEYGMMQAYAEGFDLLQASKFQLDLKKISGLWNQGSVVRSWLLELAESAFSKDPKLERLQGYVDDSGEGRWTVLESVNSGVPAPVIALSLYMRFLSRDKNAFSSRVLAALRNEFGGHDVKKS